MNHIKKIIALGLLMAGIAPKSPAQNTGLAVFARKYKIGETYRYKLVMTEYHNGELQFTNIAVCELHVVDSNRMKYDEVRWLSKEVIKGRDTTDQSAISLSTKPYRISLAGFGQLDLPRIEKAEMTEPLEDFNTFFAAVNPGFFMMGRRFTQPGDSVYMKTPIKANFSNRSTIPKGEDCLAISVKILSATEQQTHLRTSFMPPAQPCLSFILSDMNTPVVNGWANNFQMVSPLGDERFNISYGREFFYISTTLSNSDGKIVYAEMFNQLNLKIRKNCDKDYKNWQVEVPFEEERKLTLELL